MLTWSTETSIHISYRYSFISIHSSRYASVQQQIQNAEQELYLQRQLELRDLELRQLIGGQQQQQQSQLLAALTNQHQEQHDQLLQQQLHQFAQSPQNTAVLQPQQLLELQQLANPSNGNLLSSLLAGNDGAASSASVGGAGGCADAGAGGGTDTGTGTDADNSSGTGTSGSGGGGMTPGDLLSQAIRQEMLAHQQRQAVQENQIQQQQQALLQTQNQGQHQGAPIDAAHLQLEQRLAQATQRIQIQHGQQPAQYTITGASPAPQPTAQAANGGQSNNSASAPTAPKSAPKKSPTAKKTKRKVTDEGGSNPGEAAHKKRKVESKNSNTAAPEVIVLLDDKEDDPSEPGHQPKRKDIAMLLKATKDPAVKDFEYYRQELAQEAKDKGPELSLLAHEAEKKPPHDEEELSLLAHEAEKKPPHDEEDTPGSYKRIVSVLPQLPSEPDLLGSDGEEDDDGNGFEAETNSPKSLKPKHFILDGPKDKSRDKISELSSALQCGDKEDQYLTEPAFISQKEEETKPAVIACKSAVDSWWPSNSAVRKERRAQKGTHAGDEEDDKPDPTKYGIFRRSKMTIRAMQSRLDGDIEPGVLQKLPHCKLHRSRSRKETKTPEGSTVVTHSEPLFCVQVTEAHCTDVMLCCSICSTWRHAQCGGHYTKTIPKGRPNIPFRPVCDRCYEESKLIKDNPVAQGRIARQRNEHLRRSLATTSVLRHACFSKHSGQYRWPLGQVAPTHIDSHLRSVQTRHDRAEKQWRDAVAKFGAKGPKKKNPKDNAKFRMKEFERLLGYTTDAGKFSFEYFIFLFAPLLLCLLLQYHFIHSSHLPLL